MNLNKIVIGTANFGNQYSIKGIKKLETKEIEKILNFAYKKKIRNIDTAPVYGNSEFILGKIGLKNWRVSTKIQLKKNCKNHHDFILSSVSKSLNNLKVDKLENLLVHSTLGEFNKKEKIKIIETLKKLKKNKIIKNFGCSIYSPKELYDSTKSNDIDIIQAPLNIFDRRFVDKKVEKYLREKKIKLQVRSIFLRGLLLHDYNTLPRKFNYWKDNFKKYQMYLKKNRLSKTLGALSILNKIDFTSVVIGFDKYQELKDVVKNLPNNKLLIPKFNIKKINKIIDPRKW
jgi:aryl-alcohol dehydrogenase-like predicted oxidoreductase